MSVRLVQSQEATSLVFYVHILLETGPEHLCLREARVRELTAPLEDEECLRDNLQVVCLVHLPLERFQLDLSVQAFKAVPLQDIDKLEQFGNSLPLLLEVLDLGEVLLLLEELPQHFLGGFEQFFELMRAL